MSLSLTSGRRRSITLAATALATSAALALSTAPLSASSSPTAAHAAPATFTAKTGYSLCYTYYADYAIGKQVRTSHQKWFSTTWEGARSHLTGTSYHYRGLLKTWGYFYEWAYGTNGSKNCTITADILEWKVAVTNGSISHTGRTARPGVAVRLIGPDGATLCTATSATTPVAAGGFPFECSARFDRDPGTYTVTGEATRQWLRPVSATTTVVVPAAPVTPGTPGIRIVAATASPNPTTGPVTVSGTTNRPGAAVQVTRPDGSVLCTTTGSSTSVGGRFDFSCSGNLSGTPGQKRLTIRATGPNGGRTTSTVNVALQSAPATGSLKIGSVAANPNPTTGPVTISGTTNRPGAKVQVKNQDGTVLCECVGATTMTNGSFPFSCSGVVSGKPGDKTLSVRVTGPNGNTVRATLAVHKSAS